MPLPRNAIDYNRILEVDPGNHVAWYGKGISAGWLSTLEVPRIAECIQNIDTAIEKAPDREKNEMRRTAGDGLLRLIDSFTQQAIALNQDILARLPSNPTWYVREVLERPQAEVQVIQKSFKMIEMCLDVLDRIIQYDESYYTDILKFQNAIFCYMLRTTGSPITGGCAYSSVFWSLSRSSVYNKIDENTKNIMRVEPGYQNPVGSGMNRHICFIATAVYGDSMAREVVALRRFRDRFLLTHMLGRWIIKLYYLCGPHMAAGICKSDMLKATTRRLLDILVRKIDDWKGAEWNG